MRFKKLIRDNLSFSKAEVNGMFVLIPLIIFLLFTPYLYRVFFGLKYHTYEEDKRLLDSLVLIIDGGLKMPEEDRKQEIELFEFNPNLASTNELESLGIPGFLARRIENYREKGGRFREKNDLTRIYDFPDSLFNVLEPYIRIPVQKPPHEVSETPKSKPIAKLEVEVLPEEVLILDLNTADTTQLKRLKGIGSVYAKRIVAYRKLLGGYHDLDQLREVYGMNDTLFSKIVTRLSLSDSAALVKIPINLATFKELLAHPYINYEQTKEILNLKSKRGKFMVPGDLFELRLMDSSLVKKLLPYIRF